MDIFRRFPVRLLGKQDPLHRGFCDPRIIRKVDRYNTYARFIVLLCILIAGERACLMHKRQTVDCDIAAPGIIQEKRVCLCILP